MKKYIITTESGSDIPKDLAEKYNIKVVPMHVVMGREDRLDGSFPVEEVYRYYDENEKLPSTSGTNPNEYAAFFESIRETEKDSIIIHIAYSAQTTSSYSAAMLIKDQFEDLYIIDSFNVSIGLSTILVNVARFIRDNPEVLPVDILFHIEVIAKKTRFSFLPEGLLYLKAGGRVSNIAYFGASLLKIKPEIELINGRLLATKRYRGTMEKCCENMLKNYFKTYSVDLKHLMLVYTHGLEGSVREAVEAYLNAKNIQNYIWVKAGAVISTHGGPGAFGIAGIEV